MHSMYTICHYWSTDIDGDMQMTYTYIRDSLDTESVQCSVAYVESLCGRMRQGTAPTAVARRETYEAVRKSR